MVTYRYRVSTTADVIQVMLMMIFVGLVFLQIEYSQSSGQESEFLSLPLCTLLISQASVFFPGPKKGIRKERSCEMYSGASVFLAKI